MMTKNEIDAMRECVRILAPTRTQDERATMARNCEAYIAQCKWIPAFTLEQIPILFYPRAPDKARAMLDVMQRACKSGELAGIPKTHGGNLGFFASHLAAWPGCPAVPADSPLRFWLPAFMQATETPSEPVPVVVPVIEIEAAVGKSNAPVVLVPAWETEAQKRAIEIIERQRKLDLYPPQIDIADEVAKDFRAAGVVGAGKKPLTGAYIKRHALKGISSEQGKQLSTTTSRGK